MNLKRLFRKKPRLMEFAYSQARFALKLCSRFVRVEDRTAIFVSFGGRNYDDSPRALYEKIRGRKEFEGWKFYWGLKDPDRFDIEGARVVRFGSFRYWKRLLSSRLWITNGGIDRGINLTPKLSILLDTDTDSLLAGDVVHHNGNWRGIILLEPNVNGIGAGTMVYDKPLVYYLLSYFLLVGIRDITLVGSAEDKRWMDAAMGDGGDFGIRLTAVAGTLRDALDNGAASAENVMLVYGRCLLYGVDQTRFFQKAMVNRDRFTMLVLPKKIDHRTPRVAMDLNRKVVVNSEEDVLRTQYDFSGIPIVFFPAALLPEVAAAPEVASFISRYSAQNDMYVQLLDRGFVEIEAEDWHSVREAASFFQIVQDSCGMNVYCLEEVAWRRGFISAEQLRALGERRAGTDYGDYILSLCQRIVVTPESD